MEVKGGPADVKSDDGTKVKQEVKQEETLIYYITPDNKAVEKRKIAINHLPIHRDTYDSRPNTRLSVLCSLLHCDVLEVRAFPKDGCFYQLWMDDSFASKDLPYNEAATKLLPRLPISFRNPKRICGWFVISKEDPEKGKFVDVDMDLKTFVAEFQMAAESSKEKLKDIPFTHVNLDDD